MMHPGDLHQPVRGRMGEREHDAAADERRRKVALLVGRDHDEQVAQLVVVGLLVRFTVAFVS